MSRLLLLPMLLLAGCMMAHAEALAPPVDLLEGLEEGQIWAQFWGGGDTGVNGVVSRGEGGPRGVRVSPGTQFWAQTGGRQGQTTLGSVNIDLSGQRYAQVWIPTACTNINRKAPTEKDIMYAYPCPDKDMERLSRSLTLHKPAQPIIQIAVWAVANDPPARQLGGYLRRQVRLLEGALTTQDIMTGAARLLEAAGLDPAGYRMFR